MLQESPKKSSTRCEESRLSPNASPLRPLTDFSFFGQPPALSSSAFPDSPPSFAGVPEERVESITDIFRPYDRPRSPETFRSTHYRNESKFRSDVTYQLYGLADLYQLMTMAKDRSKFVLRYLLNESGELRFSFEGSPSERKGIPAHYMMTGERVSTARCRGAGNIEFDVDKSGNYRITKINHKSGDFHPSAFSMEPVIAMISYFHRLQNVASAEHPLVTWASHVTVEMLNSNGGPQKRCIIEGNQLAAGPFSISNDDVAENMTLTVSEVMYQRTIPARGGVRLRQSAPIPLSFSNFTERAAELADAEERPLAPKRRLSSLERLKFRRSDDSERSPFKGLDSRSPKRPPVRGSLLGLFEEANPDAIMDSALNHESQPQDDEMQEPKRSRHSTEQSSPHKVRRGLSQLFADVDTAPSLSDEDNEQEKFSDNMISERTSFHSVV